MRPEFLQNTKPISKCPFGMTEEKKEKRTKVPSSNHRPKNEREKKNLIVDVMKNAYKLDDGASDKVRQGSRAKRG